MKQWIVAGVCGAVIGALCTFLLLMRREMAGGAEVVRDTVTVVDTVPYLLPVPRDSVVVRYETARLPIVVRDTVVRLDSVIVRDSVAVEIPITQKRYVTDDYRAWVSGFRANLDSIYIMKSTQVINVREKTKRWGIGVQAGYGMTPDGFHPYLGLGFSFRIF